MTIDEERDLFAWASGIHLSPPEAEIVGNEIVARLGLARPTFAWAAPLADAIEAQLSLDILSEKPVLSFSTWGTDLVCLAHELAHLEFLAHSQSFYDAMMLILEAGLVATNNLAADFEDEGLPQ